MLKNNKNLITFKEVFDKLTFNNKKKLMELVYSINDYNIKNKIAITKNKKGDDFNYNISNLSYDEITYIKNYIDMCFDNCDYIEDKDYINEYIKKVSKYIKKVVDFQIKNNNEDFPFLYLLSLLKLYSDNYKDLYIFMNNIGIHYDIIRLIFFDIEVYDIYIDESGNIDPDYEEKKLFVVGGYYTKNIGYNDWKDMTNAVLDDLELNYFPNEYDRYTDTSKKKRIIFHRREIKDFKKKKLITKDIFKFIKENKGELVCIYEKNPNGIEFTKNYYLDLVSKLIVNTLNKILSDIDFDINKMLLIIHIASRGDKNASNIYDFICVNKFLDYLIKSNVGINQIKKEWKLHYEEYTKKNITISESDIKSNVYESIEEWKIKYSVANKNIDYKLFNPSNALTDSRLVFADYFCNTFYNNDGSDSKEIFKEFSIYSETKYSSFDKDPIDFYFDKYDYYTILNRYIFYKKLASHNKIGDRRKKFAENDSTKILNFFREDKKLYRRVSYLVHAVKSILDNLEIESNNEFKYDNILESYDILIKLLEKIKENNLKENFVYRKLDSIIFMINTAKLAIYNHSDNTDKSLEMIEINKSNIENIDNDYFFLREKILFDNISMVALWDFYKCGDIIKSIENVIFSKKYDDELYRDDIARLYGTLGQTYIVHYYLTEDKEDLEKAKEYFSKSKELFKDDKENIGRVYSNLMLYAITAGNEEEFLDYLYKYLTKREEKFNNIDLLIEELVSYIDNNNQPDKSDKYLIIRLLRYCKNFSTEYSRRISDILIEKSGNFYNNKERRKSSEDVDIEKDYCFVYYKRKKKNYLCQIAIYL